ncbi:MAG: tRNA lysidine(34) synthetase TilS [Bifidobacteriaceae bacterium]|jgi:tRNA(Ile)-lysidine synthase|nr:tRNA lysidine(34) synthetase TilS [Bifidobacteriaceae bacterium]
MTAPHPAEAAIRLAVRAALPGPGGAVLVACSGGPDSLALAAATAWEAPRAGVLAGAVTVDHGIQAGSDAVARQAAEACRRLGLSPVEIAAVAVPPGPNLEARARDARYAALAAAAGRARAVAVLLGHTMDDQAETVLLGLARGSGARSLAGMAPVRGLYRRPLLGVRRADTQAACSAAGLEPWADPMNQPGGEHPSRRAELRGRALPVLAQVLGPGLVPALARTAEALRADNEHLENLAAQALARAGIGGGIETEVLAREPDAVRRRALRLAALAWGAAPGALARSHIDALDALVVRWRGQGPADLPGGLRVGRECGMLKASPPIR